MAKRPALIKRKKPKKVFSRRLRIGIPAAPTKNFWSFNDYIRLEVDRKDVMQSLKQYIKDSDMTKEHKKLLCSAPDWAFFGKSFVCATIEWKKLGFDYPKEWFGDVAIEKFILELKKIAIQAAAVEAKTDDVISGPTAADIIKMKTDNFMGDLEDTVDLYFKNSHEIMMDFSAYNELIKLSAPGSIATHIANYYRPLRDELKELVDKKSADLIEAYGFMKPKQRKQYLAFIQQIIDDAERFKMSKKAVRKTRAPKIKTAEAQVKSVKFLASSNEYKLTSVPPVSIIGAKRVFLFNVKYRRIVELIAEDAKSFEIKGMQILNVNVNTSRQTTLRKPDEFLKIVLNKMPSFIDKQWAQLTTKNSIPNGRLNADSIIMRVLQK
jgi:hypothetical protein